MLYNLLVFCLASITRFVGLSWGGIYNFHPDENNMAWAIERLAWPKLDPEFFAYGQFPLYLTYFSLPKPITFNQAAHGLRFWSAVFSVATIIIGYFLAKLLFQSKYWARIYSLLLIFTPGLIQMAHFGTTGSILAFVSLTVIFLSLKYLQTNNVKFLLIASLVSAIGLASKINAVIFLFPILIAVFNRKQKIKRVFIYGFLTIILTFIFSPYYLLEFQEVFRIFKYESRIAQGTNLIFYTRQFINTTPFWFQLNKIFPWVLGLPMYLFSGVSLFIFLLKLTKKKFKNNILNFNLIILLAGFLPWFIFNSLLFVKWTRFMTPILPIIVLFIVWGLTQIKIKKILFYLLLIFLILPGILYAKMYFQSDIRIQASKWMNNNLSKQAVILYEGGNVIDLPQLDQSKFKTLTLDFYHLEESRREQQKLERYLAEADYYLMPSRRHFVNYLRLEDQYPYAANFYKQVFNEEGQFELIKKFTPFGMIGQFLLGSDTLAEETWTVFDHPTIRLFKIKK
jgi:hypothetical protein